MALSAGDRLGPYEILAPIGAGGMGEVYKATDTRLDRTVAIKVLPSHVSDNPDVRARFEREARTISKLNHPHICTLHDVGRENGVDFLVMEHIEGETLAERIGKGALPLDQALQYGIEIADALDKAHRQGVVHRDLKPGNIMLTKSGAKLLDFGLAKQQVAGSGPDLSALPTEQKSLTQPGAILGTFQYMAPEQLEGNEADARTDIFAFGAVLYEALTGQRAFHGKSQASLIGAILKDEPPPISTVQTMSPPALDHVIRRCMAKEPEERWQAASDVMRELKWVTGEGSSEAVLPAVKTQSRHAPGVGVGIVVGVLLAGLGVWSLVDADPPAAVPQHLSINLPAEAPYYGNRLHALSPDGSRLAYVAATDDALRLYLRSLDQLDVTPLAGTERAAAPFFSPDGEWVGFFEWPGGKLKKVSVRGGPPMTLCDTPNPWGASWAEDDHIVFAAESGSGSGLFRVPARGGTPEVLTTPDPASGETLHRWPQVLPGDKGILFTVTGGGSSPDRIAVFSLETGDYRTVIEEGHYGKYVPSGHVVYALGGTLMAAPFDLANLQTTGSPAPVLEGIRDVSSFASANFDFSQDGSLVYFPSTTAGRATLVAVDRTGKEVQALVAEPLENPRGIRVSPDGRRLALITAVGSNEGDLWVYHLDGRPPTRLTLGASDATPVWVQGGSRIAFSSTRAAGRDLFWIPSDGSSSEPELLLKSPHLKWARAWSHQTEELLFDQGVPGDMMTLPIEGEGEPRALVTREGVAEGLSSLSSDGRWLAYVSMVTGRYEVWVQPYPGPGAPTRISPNGGLEPVWGPGDEELFYLEDGNKMMSVKISLEPALRFEAPQMLFEGPYLHDSINVAPTYDVGPDGRFIMAKPLGGGESDRRELIMILNWFEELKRLVPTDN